MYFYILRYLDMANLFTNKKLPKRIAVIYKELRIVTSYS